MKAMTPCRSVIDVADHWRRGRRTRPGDIATSDQEDYPITLWCFGHTHTNVDFVAENGCRVISNQLGYLLANNPHRREARQRRKELSSEAWRRVLRFAVRKAQWRVTNRKDLIWTF